MSAPFLATISVLSASGAQPKGAGGGSTVLAVVTPLSGERPGHDLPGWSGPVDPGYGIGEGLRPGHDLPVAPVRPGHDLPRPPFDPARPDNSLPPGGTPVPPEVSNGLPPPAGYGDQVVVAVYVPGQGWKAKAYPEYPSHALPPTAAPKPA